MADIVMSVTSATVTVLEINPPILDIHVEGETNTAGWTDFRLRYAGTNPPPADGIYEAKVVGTPACGIVAEVVTPFAFNETWAPYPHNLEGIRLVSATNAVTARL